jgi:competence protein ComEA
MIKDYFSFTQKERIAIITLVVLILGIYFLPQFIVPVHKKPTAQELQEFRKVERELSESSKNPVSDNYTKQRGNNMDHAPPYAVEESKPARLFYFDPNTLDVRGWQQLGLRDKTIGTIQKYVAKGGRFTKPEDLKKIFGLRPDDYQRLQAYVRIASNAATNPNAAEDSNNNSKIRYAPSFSNNIQHNTSKSAFYNPSKKWEVIDINAADSTALIALPGIGSKLAARILNFREKLGGFYNIDQIKETYGLPDSTFQKIKPWLTANVSGIRKININTVTLDELKQHPYIRWNLGAVIIKYREQHGPFNSLQQLQQLGAWNVEVYNKVLPYLTLQ